MTLLVIVVAVIVGLMTGLIPLQSEGSPIDETQHTPIPAPNLVPPLIPSPNPPSPTPNVTPAQNGEVKFELAVTETSGSGLSRTITAQVTNTGDIDAHNVWGKVEVFSQGSIIKIEGKEFLRIDVGTITSGDTVTTEVTLSVGLTDGIKISQDGATLVLTIYSDELTETFPNEYSP